MFVCPAPRFAIGVVHQFADRALCKIKLLTVAVFHGLELEICIGQHAGRIGGSLQRVAHQAQDFFHFYRTHMSLPAEEVVEGMLIHDELFTGRLVHPLIEFLSSDGDDFWLHKGNRRENLTIYTLGFAAHPRGVLVRSIHGVRKPGVHERFLGAGDQLVGCFQCLH